MIFLTVSAQSQCSRALSSMQTQRWPSTAKATLEDLAIHNDPLLLLDATHGCCIRNQLNSNLFFSCIFLVLCSNVLLFLVRSKPNYEGNRICVRPNYSTGLNCKPRFIPDLRDRFIDRFQDNVIIFICYVII